MRTHARTHTHAHTHTHTHSLTRALHAQKHPPAAKTKLPTGMATASAMVVSRSVMPDEDAPSPLEVPGGLVVIGEPSESPRHGSSAPSPVSHTVTLCVRAGGSVVTVCV